MLVGNLLPREIIACMLVFQQIVFGHLPVWLCNPIQKWKEDCVLGSVSFWRCFLHCLLSSSIRFLLYSPLLTPCRTAPCHASRSSASYPGRCPSVSGCICVCPCSGEPGDLLGAVLFVYYYKTLKDYKPLGVC